MGEEKKEIDACENCKTKLCESGATMNNIPGLIEVLDRIRQEYKVVDIGGQFGMLNGTKLEALTQTICILKSLDSGGKIVPEEKDETYPCDACKGGDTNCVVDCSAHENYMNAKAHNACRQQVLINRAGILEGIELKIRGHLWADLSSLEEYRREEITTGRLLEIIAQSVVKKIASEL